MLPQNHTYIPISSRTLLDVLRKSIFEGPVIEKEWPSCAFSLHHDVNESVVSNGRKRVHFQNACALRNKMLVSMCPPGALMEDAVILEPRALGPSQCGIQLHKYSYDAGLWGDLHPPGAGAGGQTTAPKMTLVACIEAAEPRLLWLVSQRISRSPRGDQAEFLLVLSHPVGARSGCCSRAPWEVVGGGSPGDLEGASESAP